MSSGSFKNVIHKIRLQIKCNMCIYKEYLDWPIS